MDVVDGFIVGIDSYCDSWCEICGFTARCRAFAERAEREAALDPALKAVVEAPPLPGEIPPPPPRWVQELIDEMNRLSGALASDDEIAPSVPRVRPQDEPIDARARDYAHRAHVWLSARRYQTARDPADPRAVIGWFDTLVAVKIHRALAGLAADGLVGRDWPADHDGSAKVALLGMERSLAAWLRLAHDGLATAAEIEPFVADLVWLADEIERVFPAARAFVRPGFDEPEEVARLVAEEG